MVTFVSARKRGMKLLCLLLSVAMLMSMLPAALAEEGESSLGKVQVIVENTLFTTAVDGVRPKWTGELIDTEVELTADSTALSCVKAALDENEVSYDIDEATQYGAYIRGIGGLAEKQGGASSGWMATVNDWFVSESLAGITVKDGELEAGDLIRVMYSKDGGSDLGSDSIPAAPIPLPSAIRSMSAPKAAPLPVPPWLAAAGRPATTARMTRWARTWTSCSA